MEANDNIIQIMPAPENLYSAYKSIEGDEIYSPIVCIALTKDGDIKFCDVDDSGYIDFVTSNDVREFIPDILHYSKLSKVRK